MNRQLRLVLVVSIMASFVPFMDGAIVNVALPAIQRELGGGLATQQWIVDAYLLTLSSLILIAGSLSDLLGRKRILSLGLMGFGVASVLCAIAPSNTSLIIFRGLQGMAGALVVPSSLALIMSLFPKDIYAKAIGAWTAWTGIAFVIGPLAGGVIVDNASWRWIFAINVLPILLTLYMLSKIESVETQTRPKIDIAGAVLCAAGLGALIFGLIEQPHYGWGDPLIYGFVLSGAALLAGFLVYEKRLPHAMLPLSLFENHNFSVGNLATLCIYAGLSIGTFVVTIFLQQTAGYSAFHAGLSLLPITIIMFFLSPRFGGLAGKYGPRLFMGLGPIIGATGFVMMLNLGDTVSYWRELFWPVVVFGIGLSVTVAPLTAAILGDVPTERSGIASAVNNAVARIAGLVGIAAVGAILSAQFVATIHRLDKSQTYPKDYVNQLQQAPLQAPKDLGSGYANDAAVAAFHAGVATVGGLLFAGGVISLIGIRNPKPTRVQ